MWSSGVSTPIRGRLIADLGAREADNPHARPGTPLSFEDTFFLELRDDALSASLRAAEMLRELSDGGARIITQESKRTDALRVHCIRWPRIGKYGFPDCFEHELDEVLARAGRAGAGQGLVIVRLPPPNRRLDGHPGQYRAPPRQQ